MIILTDYLTLQFQPNGPGLSRIKDPYWNVLRVATDVEEIVTDSVGWVMLCLCQYFTYVCFVAVIKYDLAKSQPLKFIWG